MFINFSNHPSGLWSEKQRSAAEVYGEVLDVSFPGVPATASTREVAELADEYVERILQYEPAAVMCQGEFTLVYAVLRRLRGKGVRCLAACSQRKSVESKGPDGSVTKQSVYVFEQFREYE